jgi:hypothetical protein
LRSSELKKKRYLAEHFDKVISGYKKILRFRDQSGFVLDPLFPRRFPASVQKLLPSTTRLSNTCQCIICENFSAEPKFRLLTFAVCDRRQRIPWFSIRSEHSCLRSLLGFPRFILSIWCQTGPSTPMRTLLMFVVSWLFVLLPCRLELT